MARDYYSVLGVSRKASEKEVRHAYRRLARKYHPDVNSGDNKTEARFKEINAAYEVISDPEKRKKYDQFGENWKYADKFAQARSRTGEGPFFWQSTGHGRAPFDLGDLGDRDFGSIFTDLLSGAHNRGRSRTTVRNEPVEVPVELSLEEAYTGVSRIVQMPTTDGRPGKRLEVKVPPGVDTGSRIHVPVGDGTDLYLVLKIRSHHRFERRGTDIYVDLSVPLVDAVLGSEQEVPTLKGKVMLAMPPESQNGQVFRLRNQGMPRLNQPGSKGDLFATLKVVLPTSLSEGERQLFEDLKRGRGGKEVG
ncbi:DnaJ C-terminal domain-containing protein [Chloroflexota bacterium]